MEQTLTKQQIDMAFTFNDMRGNQLTCIDGNLDLKLVDEMGKVRKIGRVEYIFYADANGVKKDFPMLIYSKKEKADQKFRAVKPNGAWSVYHKIVEKVDGIIYYVEDKKYVITRDKAQLHGKFMEFIKGNVGIEKKLYIPLEYWKVSQA